MEELCTIFYFAKKLEFPHSKKKKTCVICKFFSKNFEPSQILSNRRRGSVVPTSLPAAVSPRFSKIFDFSRRTTNNPRFFHRLKWFFPTKKPKSKKLQNEKTSFFPSLTVLVVGPFLWTYYFLIFIFYFCRFLSFLKS